MAQSDVDICCNALQRVGAARIMNLNDNSKEARQCRLAYDDVRRSLLRMNWNFAIRRAVLPPDAKAPDFDYIYQFTLPPDCLRILLPRDACLDWVVEGRKILTNAGNVLNLRYIADIEDATQFDPLFYSAMGLGVAAAICESLTNSVSKLETIQRELKDLLSDAKKMNAFEKLPAEPPDDTFITCRMGGLPQRQINFEIQG